MVFSIKSLYRLRDIRKVRKFYRDFGSPEERLLDWVREDWGEAVQVEYEWAAALPAAGKINPYPYWYDGVRYKAYGITHTNHFDYLSRIISNTFRQRQFMSEAYLASNYSIDKGIEVPDFELYSPMKEFLFSFYYRFRQYWEEIRPPPITDTQVSLRMHPAAAHELPPMLELWLAERDSTLSPDQERSAYLVEMARHFYNIFGIYCSLVGVHHVTEMEYFGLNGIKDKKIIELAEVHANHFVTQDHEQLFENIYADRGIAAADLVMDSILVGGTVGIMKIAYDFATK
jgi:hypothetical protein